jgi:hypothetical protein
MWKPLAGAIFGVGLLTGVAAAQPSGSASEREADHQQLRALLTQVRDAINARKLHTLDGALADHFAITLADGQLVTDIAKLKTYYTDLLEPKGPLRSLTLNPAADELTEFVAPDVGICHGTSDDTFVLANGTTRVLRSRWTATLVKVDGAWKLKAFQAGANVLDNVILDEHKRAAFGIGVGGAAGALLLGGVGFLLGRRRSA